MRASAQGLVEITLSVRAVSVGNLVWHDENQNGIKDPTEVGIDGVTLQIHKTDDAVIGNGDDTLLSSTTSAGGGLYSFENLTPGIYYLSIPTVPAGYVLSSGPQIDLDDGVDGDNNGIQVGGKGTPVVSPVITLALDSEPGNLGGGNTDATVDFAFRGVPNPGPNILEFEMNQNSGGLPVPPSLRDPAIINASFLQAEDDLNGLDGVSEPTTNGPMRPGAMSRAMSDWDQTYDTSLEAVRTNLAQRKDSLWTRFDLNATTTGNIGGIAFDVKRDSVQSPDHARVFITWKDGSLYRTAWTDALDLTAIGSWYSFDLGWTGFNNGATALPSGAQLNGKSFLIEIYFWGGDGTGDVTVDNVLVGGSLSIGTAYLSLGDFIWADSNNNGIKNAREPGLPDVPIELWKPGTDNLQNTVDDVFVSASVTDTNGYYLFSGLAPGLTS
jgi:hypothetical protein